MLRPWTFSLLCMSEPIDRSSLRALGRHYPRGFRGRRTDCGDPELGWLTGSLRARQVNLTSATSEKTPGLSFAEALSPSLFLPDKSVLSKQQHACWSSARGLRSGVHWMNRRLPLAAHPRQAKRPRLAPCGQRGIPQANVLLLNGGPEAHS